MPIVIGKTNETPLSEALAAAPLFEGIGPDLLALVLSNATKRSLRPKEVLFERGAPADRFAIVLRGALKILRFSPAGQSSLVFVAAPFQPVGALLMSKQNAQFPVTVVALEESEVALIPRATYLEQWLRVPALAARMNLEIYERMAVLQRAKASSRMSLRARVALALLQLAPSAGTPSASRVRLSRQELAEAVDCSVEALIRMLGKLASEGIVSLDAREVEIHDPIQLRALAECTGD